MYPKGDFLYYNYTVCQKSKFTLSTKIYKGEKGVGVYYCRQKGEKGVKICSKKFKTEKKLQKNYTFWGNWKFILKVRKAGLRFPQKVLASKIEFKKFRQFLTLENKRN